MNRKRCDGVGVGGRTVDGVTGVDGAVVIPLRPVLQRDSDAATLTIKDVADACGLPQPVIAQRVPHTDTKFGRMYSTAQLSYAVELAAEYRRAVNRSPRLRVVREGNSRR